MSRLGRLLTSVLSSETFVDLVGRDSKLNRPFERNLCTLLEESRKRCGSSPGAVRITLLSLTYGYFILVIT